MKRPLILVGAVAIGALALAGCSSGGNDVGPSSGEKSYVDGATFTMTVTGDPGKLDPQLSPDNTLNQLTQFAYDPLVSIDDKGKIHAQLASDWKVDETTLTFTLKDGITCSDGSPFTADTAAKNIAFVADPANQSPFLGVYVTPGMTAKADGSTLTVTLAAPAPFALNGLANLGMVCDAGMADRSTLAAKTDGTGPYVLSEGVPNDHYTYTVRKDYTWGPDGATTAEKGMPAKIVARVVANETTAANLILSGEANAGGIFGPDAKRLTDAKLFTVKNEALFGQQWYNQSAAHVTSDPAVRMALTQSVDMGELAKVATGGTGSPATTFAVVAPAACPGDSISGALPKFDVKAAGTLLDGAGWVAGSDGMRAKDGKPLTVKFAYNSAMGTNGTAAAELNAKQWKDLGVKVDMVSQDPTLIQDTIFNSGDWDVSWVALNVSSPDQIVGFMSGDAPTNFGHINNTAYTEGVAKAAGLSGTDGCSTWLDAESNLVKGADVIPFANTILNTFGNKAEFAMSGSITPTSIRMLG